MSITTSTKSYRDLTKRQAIALCYILEEQRDRQIARAEKGEAKVAAVRALADRYDAWDGSRDSEWASSPRTREQLRTALTGAGE